MHIIGRFFNFFMKEDYYVQKIDYFIVGLLSDVFGPRGHDHLGLGQ